MSAGYELVKSGFKVKVLEKENQVGGLAKTIKVGDFKFDTGPHRWYTKNDMVNNWMLKLLDTEIIKVPRLTRIYFDHKYFHYPIRIGSTLAGMGFFLTSKAVFDYLLVQLENKFRPKDPVTIEEGYISQFGKTLYQMFFKRYTEKLWGRSCKEISADWLGQRSRGFNIGTIIKNALFKSKKVISFVDEFSYPGEGIGRISERLAEDILKSGSEIVLGSEVVRINSRKDRITSVEVKEKGKTRVYSGDEFVSSIAISDFIDGVNPPVPPEVARVSGRLSFRDEIQVVLFVKKSHITRDTWIYVHSQELPFVRFMEMDNWSSKLAPKGKTALVFEISCNYQDNIWKMKDKEVVKWVENKFISEFGLIRQKDIIGSFVNRVQKEYPVYHIGYKKDLTYLKKYLGRFPNLQLIGRNGAFRYNNMDHSVEMGLYAAWNIMEGERKFNVDAVNIEREYLEEKRIVTHAPELPEDQYVEEKKN